MDFLIIRIMHKQFIFHIMISSNNCPPQIRLGFIISHDQTSNGSLSTHSHGKHSTEAANRIKQARSELSLRYVIYCYKYDGREGQYVPWQLLYTFHSLESLIAMSHYRPCNVPICVTSGLFSPWLVMPHSVMCFQLIHFFMIVRICVIHFIFAIKYKIWRIRQCLWLNYGECYALCVLSCFYVITE